MDGEIKILSEDIMQLLSLIDLKQGESGLIHKIDEDKLAKHAHLNKGDVEAYLLEMGFVEGAHLKVLHLGLWDAGPIAVRINNNSSVMAIRRSEAAAILVEKINA